MCSMLGVLYGGCASGDTSSAAARAASAASPRCDRPKESTGGTRWRSRCSRAAGARMQRVARRMLDGGRAVGVLHQQQRGRPRRPLLAALAQEISVLGGGTAGVQGGGALTSGVLRAVWLMAFKQGGLQLQQRRGRPRQPLLAMLTQRAKQAALGGAAGVHRWQSTRGQCAAAWWMVVPSSGGMALAAAREASAASSCRHACLGRPQRYSLWRPTAPSAAVVDGAE